MTASTHVSNQSTHLSQSKSFDKVCFYALYIYVNVCPWDFTSWYFPRCLLKSAYFILITIKVIVDQCKRVFIVSGHTIDLCQIEI